MAASPLPQVAPDRRREVNKETRVEPNHTKTARPNSERTDLRTGPIQSFADKHRLKTRIGVTDGCKIIPGKLGHIYEYSSDLLGVMVMPDPPRKRYWGCVRATLLKAGCALVQDGDGEGAAIFDPKNPRQARAAIRAASAKRKRELAPEQRERQIARLRASAGGALSAAETRRKPRTTTGPPTTPGTAHGSAANALGGGE